MTTAYTQPVTTTDGYTFREFAWRCARAFGALLHMRDDALDAPISFDRSRLSGSDYHTKELADAQARLERFGTMSLAAATVEADREYADVAKMYAEYVAEAERENARVNAMLAQVRAWEPPSSDHAGLCDFMLEQLHMSLRSPGDAPKRLLADEWLKQKIARATEDIAYHQTKITETKQRDADAEAWLTKLRESVGDPPKVRGAK